MQIHRRPRSAFRSALVALALAAVAGCSDDPSGGTTTDVGAVDAGTVDAGPPDAAVAPSGAGGIDGPRFDAETVTVFGDTPLLLPGRRYAVYSDRDALESAWRTLFVDAGLAVADELPPVDRPGHAVVGVYLGEQRAGNGSGAWRHDIGLSAYADDDGVPVVQVDVRVVTDCGAAPATVPPAPWRIEAVALPAGTDASDVRFVDVLRQRTERCSAAPAASDTLKVVSPSRFGVSIGIEPAAGRNDPSTADLVVRAPASIGSSPVPTGPEERLTFAGQLPGLSLPFGLFTLPPDEPRGDLVTVGLDAPSDLFEERIDLEDYLGYLRALAGAGARDCAGEAAGGPTDPDACEADAFAAGAPFVAAFERRGTDSSVWSGKAVTAEGRLFVAGFDSDPFGNARPDAGRIDGFACARAELADGAVICAERYPEPRLVRND